MQAQIDARCSDSCRLGFLPCLHTVCFTSKRVVGVTSHHVCGSEGNHSAVRIAAFDALLLLKGFQEKAVVRYLFIVLRDDVCLLVRRRLAEGILQSLPILVATEDLGRDEDENRGFEEDLAEEAKKGKAAIDHRNVFRSLRHEVGRAVILRECISAVMLCVCLLTILELI